MIFKIITTILFFIYTYGLGSLVLNRYKCGALENIFLKIACGLALFPIIGIGLSLCHIPIHWSIFFILSLIGIAKNRSGLFNGRKISVNLKEMITFRNVTLLILIGFCLLIYCYGPFHYAWLEDDDPWQHAAGAKFIALEKTVAIGSGIFQYINPYPPGYDLIMAVLHQTLPSIYWTLKFFNGLIITLGIIFFYFFAKELFKDQKAALCSTAILVAAPSYMSHFIWAHSLAIALFFPAFYFFIKAGKDKRNFWPAVICLSGVFLSQPTQSIKCAAMILLIIFAWLIVYRKFPKQFIFIPLTMMVVVSLWYLPFVVPQWQKGDMKIMATTSTKVIEDHADEQGFLSVMFNPKGGSATRSYSWRDYVFPPKSNMINCPLGVGMTILFLSLLGFLHVVWSYRRAEAEHRFVYFNIILWMLFCFLGLNSETFSLPIGLYAFRFWPLLTIVIALLAGMGMMTALNILSGKKRTLFLVLICFTIFSESAAAKYRINTAIWRAGLDWPLFSEMSGYVWLRKNIPLNTKVFMFTKNYLVIGHDMRSDYWDLSYQEDFEQSITEDLYTFHQKLIRHQYEYLVIGDREKNMFGRQIMIDKVRGMNESALFSLIYQVDGNAWIFKVNNNAT